ncbi:MAG TPA: DoxX family protein, partial [Burkholderiaceae bacterium]|nr:DoxX family protein [Burkholderiaceae bacterium]
MAITQTLVDLGQRARAHLNFLAPVIDLTVRLWVAAVFFKSGLTKIQSWDTTLLLFENEYQVPFLSPETAALLGTGAELVLPVLLALGLG